MKKFVTIILSIMLVMAVLFPAQAADSKSTKVDKTPFKLTIASWTLDTDASKPANKSTIDYLAAVEKTFKAKYPNATIELHNTGSEKYKDVLKAKLASNSVEDIFMHQGDLAPLSLLGKNNYCVDLSDQPWAKNVMDLCKPNIVYKGKLIAAPYDISGWGCWYNKKIFSDNNIKLPKTYADFLAICATLKAKGIQPLVGGFKDTWTTGGWELLTAAAFILPTDPNFEMNLFNGTDKFYSPKYAKVFTSFQNLIEKGYYNKNLLSIGWDQSRAEFEKGNGAMLIQGSWMPGSVAAEAKDFQLGFMPIPGDKGEIIMTASGGNYTSISSRSKLISQAKDYIIAMLDKNNLPIRINDSSIPGLKGYDIKYSNPATLEYKSAFDNNKTALQFTTYFTGSVNTDVQNEFLKIASGKKFNPKDLQKFDIDYQADKGQIVFPGK